MKPYKAIFFDWDGTAVTSRKAPADQVAEPMKRLLAAGVKLVIVSGTTYENIAGGELHTFFTPKELNNLYLGLGRGAYNYRFDDSGAPYLWKSCMPDQADLLKIHDACYEVHRLLLGGYGFPTDIVFSRPNYCKVDLMVDKSRGDRLFLQEHEAESLSALLLCHQFPGGIPGLISLAEETARRHGITLTATSDAKYLEIGMSSKRDNVDTIFAHLLQDFGVSQEECSFWGDEYVGLGEGLFGSDSFMITPMTRGGAFFDVSEVSGLRPNEVSVLGGGVERFIRFLQDQSDIK